MDDHHLRSSLNYEAGSGIEEPQPLLPTAHGSDILDHTSQPESGLQESSLTAGLLSGSDKEIPIPKSARTGTIISSVANLAGYELK